MKYKRPMAIFALILIALLYAAAILAAFINSPYSQGILMTALFCTIVIPVVIYTFSMVTRLTKKELEHSDEINEK